MSFRASAAEAVLRLGVDTREFDKGLSDAERRAKDMGKSLKSLGKSLTTYMTLPLAGAATAAIKVSSDFETAMLRVEGVTGATGNTLKALQDQAKELGVTTQHSAKAAAEGMTFLAMAGLEVDQIMGALPATLSLATAGQMDLGRAADVASNIMTTFKLRASEMDSVVDQLAGAFMSSNTSMEQMAEAMKYGGPVASSLGNEVADVAAIIGIFGNAGIQASMAGTTLRQMLAQLAAPTEKLQKKLDALGVSLKDADGNMLGIVEIVKTFEGVGLKAADAFELLGVRAGTGLAVALSAGSDAIQNLENKIRKSDGAAKRLADTLLEGLKGHFDLMTSAMTGFAIAITEAGLGDVLKGIMDRLRGLFQWASELPKPILAIGTVLAGLAAIVGPGIVMYASLLSVWIKLTAAGGPLAASVTAVTGAFTALKTVAFGPVGIAAGILGIAFAFEQMRIAKDNLRIAELTNDIRMSDDPLKDAATRVRELGGQMAELKEKMKVLTADQLFMAQMDYEDLRREYDAVIEVLDELRKANRKAWEQSEAAASAAEIQRMAEEAAERERLAALEAEKQKLKELISLSQIYSSYASEDRWVGRFSNIGLTGVEPGITSSMIEDVPQYARWANVKAWMPELRNDFSSLLADGAEQGMKEAIRIARSQSKKLADAIVDGKGIMEALGKSIQASVTQIITEGVGKRLSESLGKSLGAALGTTFGGPLGSILGSTAGATLGAAAGGVLGWFGSKIGGWLGFGGNEEEKRRAQQEREAAQRRIDEYNEQKAREEAEAARQMEEAAAAAEKAAREAAAELKRLEDNAKGVIQAFVDTGLETKEFIRIMKTIPQDMATEFTNRVNELKGAKEELNMWQRLKSGIAGDLPPDFVEKFLTTGEITDELLQAAIKQGVDPMKLIGYAEAKDDQKVFQGLVDDLRRAKEGTEEWEAAYRAVMDFAKQAGTEGKDLNDTIRNTSLVLKTEVQTAATDLDKAIDGVIDNLRLLIQTLEAELLGVIDRIAEAFASIGPGGWGVPEGGLHPDLVPHAVNKTGAWAEGPSYFTPEMLEQIRKNPGIHVTITDDTGEGTDITVDVHDEDENLASSLGNSWDDNTQGIRDRIGS